MADTDTAQQLPARSWPIQIGGLFRCCTLTHRESDVLLREGDSLKCLHCPTVMVVKDGVVRWADSRLSDSDTCT